VLLGSGYLHGMPRYIWRDVSVDVLRTDLFDKWRRHFQHFMLFPQLQRHFAAAYAMHEQARAGEGFDAVEVVDWGMLFMPWVLEASAPTLVQLHGSCGQIGMHDPRAGAESEDLLAILIEATVLAHAEVNTHSLSNRAWWNGVLGREIGYQLPAFELPPLDQVRETPRNDRFLAVGRIQKWKGPQVACAAWAKLGESAPRLDWIGRDTEFGEKRLSMDEQLKLLFPGTWRRVIQPLGQKSPEDIYRHMQSAKAVVVPSTWDAFNLVTAEAMALATPVIVSSGAGAVDLVETGKNGFTFPNGDAEALMQEIEHVNNLSHAELSEIGENGRETIRRSLCPVSVAAAKAAIYRKLKLQNHTRIDWLSQSLHKQTSSSRTPLDDLPIKTLGKALVRRLFDKVWHAANHE